MKKLSENGKAYTAVGSIYLVGIIFFTISMCIVFSGGCRNQTVIHSIDKLDIFSVPSGSVIRTDPNSSSVVTVEKDGWFLSDTYVQEVMEVKIEE